MSSLLCAMTVLLLAGSGLAAPTVPLFSTGATHVFRIAGVMNTSSVASVSDTGIATGAWLLRGGGGMAMSPGGLVFAGDGQHILPAILPDMTVLASSFTITSSYQQPTSSAASSYALCNFGGFVVVVSPPSPSAKQGVLTVANTAGRSTGCSASFYLTSASPTWANWGANTMKAVSFSVSQPSTGTASPVLKPVNRMPIPSPTIGGKPFQPIPPPLGGPAAVCDPVVWHGLSPMVLGTAGYAAQFSSASRPRDFVGTVASVTVNVPTPPPAMASPAAAVHEWCSMGVQACLTNETAGGPTYCGRTNAMVAVAAYEAHASLAGLPCTTPSPRCFRAPLPPNYKSENDGDGDGDGDNDGDGDAAAVQIAVSRAGRDVLASLFPSQVADFDALHARVVARVAPDKASLAAGEKVGSLCAKAVVTLRANDSAFRYDLNLESTAVTAFMAQQAPGYWQPATTDGSLLIPGFMMALGKNWPFVTPWIMTTGAQFLAPGPPPLNSSAWLTDYNLLYQIGAVNSATRTADQTAQAHFWAAEGGGSTSPPGHWVMNACKLALENKLSMGDTLKMMAMMTTTIADAVITAWTGKYTYDQWRPVTAIPAGGGFPGGRVDGEWLPLLPTPPFPDYISGHSTLGAAAATILEHFLGKTTPVSLYSPTSGMAGVLRSWPSLDAAQSENAYSRVYGGVHWRSSCADAVAAGKALGSFALSAWNY